jgi:insertion element IS1 protein InsB
MWRVVKQRANKPWSCIAMDATPRQVMAFHVGARSRDSARELGAKMPVVYRAQATFHTAQDDAYSGVMPEERHKALTKNARQTNHLERFHTTLSTGHHEKLSKIV